jgi:transcriptional regulator with XRE-family HTH domain
VSKLADLRIAKGMTQVQLAKRITASRRSFIDWELRRARPRQVYIERLTRLFHVSVDELDLKGLPMA